MLRASILLSFTVATLFAACGGGDPPAHIDPPVATGGAPSVVETGPPCAKNADCTRPTPFCDIKGGHCVECFAKNNCPGTNTLCRASDHKCVMCLTVADCGYRRPYCSPDGKCVQCLSTSNCGSPQAVCNPGPSACVPVCKSDADCASSTDYPKCDTVLGGCTECATDADCPGRYCQNGLCVACLQDTDCIVPEQPFCDTTTNQCVACRTNADCSPGQECFGSTCTTAPAP